MGSGVVNAGFAAINAHVAAGSIRKPLVNRPSYTGTAGSVEPTALNRQFPTGTSRRDSRSVIRLRCVYLPPAFRKLGRPKTPSVFHVKSTLALDVSSSAVPQSSRVLRSG